MTTPGLSGSQKTEIHSLGWKLLIEYKTFTDNPSNESFKVFKSNCEQRIHQAEQQFAKEPFIWSLLKPICDLMITLFNNIKSTIWPKTHTTTSIFKNVAETAWESSKIGPHYKALLENRNLEDALQYKEEQTKSLK